MYLTAYQVLTQTIGFRKLQLYQYNIIEHEAIIINYKQDIELISRIRQKIWMNDKISIIRPLGMNIPLKGLKLIKMNWQM